MATKVAPLPKDKLRRCCALDEFDFKSTEELPTLETVIGQDRALSAVSFGINIQSPGYHMFALGPPGTGRTTTIKKFLEHDAEEKPVPSDWLYINNFDDADKPRALRLPAGSGRIFRDDMDELVEELRTEVPQAFEGEDYHKEREQLEADFQRKRNEIMQELEREAQGYDFKLMQTPQGIALTPIVNGEAVQSSQISQLSDEQREDIEQKREKVQGKVRETMRRSQRLQQEAKEKLRDLDRQVVGFTVGHLIDELKEKYDDYERIKVFLDEAREDILKNVEAFKQLRQMEQAPEGQQGMLAAMMGGRKPSFEEYRANLVVDNSGREGAPVRLERNPTFRNLVGRIEHQGQFGALVTNFRMIRAGALHQANGGYLMVEAMDLLTKPFAWQVLKRALKSGVIDIESLSNEYSAISTRTLEPEPIPLSIKTIIVGTPLVYYLLHNMDDDFHELFKVKADFSTHMDWTSDTCTRYAEFIGTICKEENLPHFDPSGVAKIVEQSARMVAHQDKLATKFGDIVDLIRQSCYWAGTNDHKLVNGGDVKRAIDERIYRSNRLEERLREMIEEGSILIDTEGKEVGQVNGLSFIPLGDYNFGKPSRVTARTYVGNAGIVSIDREAELGGKIHNKGAMVLAGYLGGTFAGDAPLALTASITFEQLYEHVDGDSASSTELYALLSSLSGVPLRQDLAVTGSVNQHGEIQAIGGVNEKIEGFYDVCRVKGFSGSQGVLIPESNVNHLMLREDVVQSVENGEFHIYPVSTVSDGIALLTGKEAGEPDTSGKYPGDTIYGAVQQRLEELTTKMKEFAKASSKSRTKTDTTGVSS
ncbi:MAG: AAA family ATPase [Candidatus Pacebacteria bacterium]|nr:AAA family ATPase [Candidatus Paceibacterota bacterium]